MEDQEARELRLAQPTAEDIVATLTDDQIEIVRNRVRPGIEEIARGEFTEYVGREGLSKLRVSKGAVRDLDVIFVYWAENVPRGSRQTD
jgi:hypothetical protein